MPVAGGSLRGFSSTRMEIEELFLISRQIISTLQYLHREEIVHTDIKSEIILYIRELYHRTYLPFT